MQSIAVRLLAPLQLQTLSHPGWRQATVVTSPASAAWSAAHHESCALALVLLVVVAPARAVSVQLRPVLLAIGRDSPGVAVRHPFAAVVLVPGFAAAAVAAGDFARVGGVYVVRGWTGWT